MTVAAGSNVASAAPDGTDGFTTWYEAEHPKVLAVLCTLSGDPKDARKAADEAFSRCYTRWDSLRGHHSQDRWACRVALRALRRAQWRRRLDPQLRRSLRARDRTSWAAEGREPRQYMPESSKAAQLVLSQALSDGDPTAPLSPAYRDAAEVLAPLSPRQRRAMVLRHVAGLTDADIAWVMRLPRGTVTATLTQAQRRLASCSDLPAYLEEGADG